MEQEHEQEHEHVQDGCVACERRVKIANEYESMAAQYRVVTGQVRGECVNTRELILPRRRVIGGLATLIRYWYDQAHFRDYTIESWTDSLKTRGLPCPV